MEFEMEIPVEKKEAVAEAESRGIPGKVFLFCVMRLC